MGVRILVADNQFIAGFDLCNTFTEAGYEVEGPHAGIAAAMLACQKKKPDIAILDIELIDGLSYELARKLIDDNVRVILHCENLRAGEIAARFPDAATVPKPCPPADLLRAVNRVLMPA